MIPLDLQNAAGRFLSITEWMAKKTPEILYELVNSVECEHDVSDMLLEWYKRLKKIGFHGDEIKTMVCIRSIVNSERGAGYRLLSKHSSGELYG